MGIKRRLKRKLDAATTPIVEANESDVKFHLGMQDGAGQIPIALQEALHQLGYCADVEEVSPALIMDLRENSGIPEKYISEAIRLNGVYCRSANSILFRSDKRWRG